MSTNQHIDQTFDEFNEANQNLYGEGFIDGVEDTFTRVAAIVRNDRKKTKEGSQLNNEVIEYQTKLLERLNKLKNKI